MKVQQTKTILANLLCSLKCLGRLTCSTGHLLHPQHERQQIPEGLQSTVADHLPPTKAAEELRSAVAERLHQYGTTRLRVLHAVADRQATILSLHYTACRIQLPIGTSLDNSRLLETAYCCRLVISIKRQTYH